PMRHIEEKHNVPMYITNIPASTSGVFKGNITVSMRPMTMADAIKATEITTQFKDVHGTPIHIGNPSEIGIQDINTPDFGDPVQLKIMRSLYFGDVALHLNLSHFKLNQKL